MAGRQDYAERKQAKIDRLTEAACKAEQESEVAYKRGKAIAANIPFGQPILVGHHSEKHARADAQRIENAYLKTYESAEKAEYFAKRAAAVENNTAISSDDPDSIEKLQEKIDRLTAKKEFCKAVNAYYRKHKTCKGFVGAQGVLTDELAAKLDAYAADGYQPVAGYELTSLNQRIRAAQERIARLKVAETMPDETIEFDGGEIESSSELNRVIIRFYDRQSEEVTAQLKRNGFKWSPTSKGWQRLRTPWALRLAKELNGATAPKKSTDDCK